ILFTMDFAVRTRTILSRVCSTAAASACQIAGIGVSTLPSMRYVQTGRGPNVAGDESAEGAFPWCPGWHERV
ncbi:unnamed protein product, partial [Effrenium voratum]